MKKNNGESEKKVMIEEWLKAFPQLLPYTDNKLYKIVDCLVLGIELIKLPHSEAYRPHFVCYSLWKENLKECFISPTLLKVISNDKGVQLNIPYTNQSLHLSKVMEEIKRNSVISFKGDVSLESIFTLIDAYAKMPPLSAAPNSYLQARLAEFKLELAICKAPLDVIQNILYQINTQKWDIKHFELWGVKADEWLESINCRLDNKAKYLTNVEINKQDGKLKKIDCNIYKII